MNIKRAYEPPDNTYIKVTDIEPEISGDSLLMTAGRGTWRRSWGAPAADYEIVLNGSLSTSVVVWWKSKHASGQAWRHYRKDAGGWMRVTWPHLSDCERQTVLGAYRQPSVPGWVRSPGKLASQRAKPRQHEQLERDEQGAIIGYKYLGYDTNGPYSPSLGTRWHSDELTAHIPPTEHNDNGIYAAKTPNAPELTFYRADGRRLVRLLLSGIVIEGQFGLRAEHAQIMEVLP